MTINQKFLKCMMFLFVAGTLTLVIQRTVAAQWAGSGNIYYNGGSVGVGTATPNKSGVSNAVTVNGSSDAIYELAIGDVRKSTIYHNGSTLSITNNANGAFT